MSGEFAEAMAIKEALSWIKEKNWSHVQLESDSLVIVQAIRSKIHMLSPLGLLIQECRNLLGKIHMTAHTLAGASYSFLDQEFNSVGVLFLLKSRVYC